MKKYKHYSFDLWLTLIKSNPRFKKERALLFFREYNVYKKSLEEVELVFRRLDLMCNLINEKTGNNIDAEEMYLMVLYELNNDGLIFEEIDLNLLYNQIETLFFNFPPILYSNETVEVLSSLKEIPNITMSILSNTAYIKGATLRSLLHELNFSKYFDFQIYSDEVNVSKPNPVIFNALINSVQLLHSNIPLAMDEIIHIGDNASADIKGAKSVGIQSLLINNNGATIKSLLAQ